MSDPQIQTASPCRTAAHCLLAPARFGLNITGDLVEMSGRVAAVVAPMIGALLIVDGWQCRREGFYLEGGTWMPPNLNAPILARIFLRPGDKAAPALAEKQMCLGGIFMAAGLTAWAFSKPIAKNLRLIGNSLKLV